MKKNPRNILKFVPWIAGLLGGAAQAEGEEDLWQQVYDARTSYYEALIGQFPQDILKMGNMIGVWPGGGLYVIPAEKIGNGLWVYTTAEAP